MTKEGCPGSPPAACIPAASITLGILAGGLGTRLGGLDKAWLQRDGQPQVLWLAQQLASDVSNVIISANRDLERYAAHRMPVVVDLIPDIGPVAALDALVHASTTSWLLTLPVDVIRVDDCLVRRLVAAGVQGAFAHDDDGPQPLVALWHVDRLSEVLAEAIARGDFAVHALQSRLGMARVCFDGIRFGNLNTLADLVAAGIQAPPQ